MKEISLIFVSHSSSKVRVLFYEIIANLCCGNSSQIDQFLKNRFLIDKLLDKVKFEESKGKKDLLRIFKNICIDGDPEKIMKFYCEKDILQYYEYGLFMETSEEFLALILEYLLKIVEFSEANKVKGESILSKKIRLSAISSRILELEGEKENLK